MQANLSRRYLYGITHHSTDLREKPRRPVNLDVRFLCHQLKTAITTLADADIAVVFDASGIRRPTNDWARLQRMFANANLIFPLDSKASALESVEPLLISAIVVTCPILQWIRRFKSTASDVNLLPAFALKDTP